jgi:hypothetical protein
MKKEKMMFEIGDSVVIVSFNKPIVGKIVGWNFDEGNVWSVRSEGGNLYDCCDSELVSA